MEERNRGRVAAVLAADADLEIAAHLAAPLGAHAHKLADARLVDGDKWVPVEHLPLQIVGEDRCCVVARKTEARLGEVIGAERKELGTTIPASDLIRLER